MGWLGGCRSGGTTPEADALGRDLWNGATRSGDNLWGGRPSALTALGLAALRGRIEPGSNRSVGDGGSDFEIPDDYGLAASQAGTSVPGYKTVTARPGDSISRLMGTSRPDAIGRFASLNELGNSNLQTGQSYRVPMSYDDATSDESAVGNRLLRSDNARLAARVRARAANQAPNDLFAQRLNAGLNAWTGEAQYNPSPASGRTPPPGAPNWWDVPAKLAGGTAAYGGGL